MAFAVDAGSYENLWALNAIFGELLGYGATIGKRKPRDKRGSFHKNGSVPVVWH